MATQVKMGRQPLKLVQEVETQCNSTFDMVQRLYELHESIAAAMESLYTDVNSLFGTDFEIISQ